MGRRFGTINLCNVSTFNDVPEIADADTHLAPLLRNVTTDDNLWYSDAFPMKKIKDVMSPTQNHYCYIYD